MKEYFCVSSTRMAKFLYSLGFDKESFYNKDGKEKWRFEKSNELLVAVDFYKKMRELNNYR